MDSMLVWMPQLRLWLCVGADGQQGMGATQQDALAQWRAAVAAQALIKRLQLDAATRRVVGHD